jgi:hypothetical protein
VKRRVAVIAALIAAAVPLLGAVPANAEGALSTNARGRWVCVAVEATDYGFCQGNPLPDRLPLPVILLPI